MHGMLFGRTFDDWRYIDTVMQAHDIKTPKQLNERLGPAASRVNVYDSRNPDRLLGSVARPTTPANGCDRYRLSVMPRMPRLMSTSVGPETELRYTTIDFAYDHRASPDKWTVEAILTTSATLNDLMKLREFRLPGETNQHAEHRQYCA